MVANAAELKFEDFQTADTVKQTHSEMLPIPELDIYSFDHLDIVMLNKFVNNFCYTIQGMADELVREKKIRSINPETVRKRFERNFVPKNLVIRVKTFGVIYELNEAAKLPIKNLTKKFMVIIGASELI